MEIHYTEMNGWQLLKSKLHTKWIIFRRKYIPYLVWYGQELDVCVTWKENKLSPYSNLDNSIPQLQSGHLYKISQMMGEIGVTFDQGMGFQGRDWEWDFSLRGPISVKFRKPCKTKEKRT